MKFLKKFDKNMKIVKNRYKNCRNKYMNKILKFKK